MRAKRHLAVFAVFEYKGALPYSITWQSLDGRLQTEYCATLPIARGRRDFLLALKLKPKIWADVTDL